MRVASPGRNRDGKPSGRKGIPGQPRPAMSCQSAGKSQKRRHGGALSVGEADQAQRRRFRHTWNRTWTALSLFSGLGFFGEYDTRTAPEPELGQAPRQGSALGERQRTLRRGIWHEWRGCLLTAPSICSARALVSCACRFPYPSTCKQHSTAGGKGVSRFSVVR